jgi:hypothetical protein
MIAKPLFFDSDSDVIGLFAILMLLFLLIFNIYAFVLLKFYPKNERKNWSVELGFTILLLLPVLILLYFST